MAILEWVGSGRVWQIKTEHEQRMSGCSSREENNG